MRLLRPSFASATLVIVLLLLNVCCCFDAGLRKAGFVVVRAGSKPLHEPPPLPQLPPSQPYSQQLKPPPLFKQCLKPKLRKEWRQISDLRKEQFFTGVELMKKAPSKMNTASLYDDFVYIHFYMNSEGHKKAAFLPWHRAFIQVFENSMIKLLKDPTYYLPYWQWGIDAQAPERSPIFADDAFGDMGDRITKCVNRGRFAGWNRTVPRLECLKRSGSATIGSFWAPEMTRKLLKESSSFKEMRREFENHPHAVIHNSINGDFSKNASPGDPLFYLHHANVDRLWMEWQRLDPKRRFTVDYDGDLNSIMTPFKYRVAELMDPLANSELCYQYTPGLAPIKPGHFPANLFVFVPQSTSTIPPRPPSPPPPPLSRDRTSDPRLLRVPEPISSEWIACMMLDEGEIRLGEDKYAKDISEINKTILNGTYSSPYSLSSPSEYVQKNGNFWS